MSGINCFKPVISKYNLSLIIKVNCYLIIIKICFILRTFFDGQLVVLLHQIPSLIPTFS